jgi:integrase
MRFHDLRHTFATLLLSSRTHPKNSAGDIGPRKYLDDDSKIQNNLSCGFTLC